MESSLFRKKNGKKLMLAVVGIFLVGTGLAFNAAAALGNDPVGIVYDGIRSAANLSPTQLGMASNIVNVTLMVIVFLLNRHYVNIGTFIYILPYGFVVDLGGRMYRAIIDVDTQPLPVQIAGAAVGCTLLYLGVAMYITADIGLDPFTGIVMVLKDIVKKEYHVVKICFDIFCVALGTILGGKLGVITIVTAFTAGPLIGFFAKKMRGLFRMDE